MLGDRGPAIILECLTGWLPPMRNKMTGRIIKVSRQGWGFISSREIEFTRIFFHWTSLKQNTLKWKELRTGMRCNFEPIEIPGKGFRAIKVEIIEREKTDEPDVPTLPEQRQEPA